MGVQITERHKINWQTKSLSKTHGAPEWIRTTGLRFRKPTALTRWSRFSIIRLGKNCGLGRVRSSFDPHSGASCTSEKGLSMTTDKAARVEHHTDRILRASGSGLRNYTMALTRRAILSATTELYEEAYRAGAKRGAEIARLSPQTVEAGA